MSKTASGALRILVGIMFLAFFVMAVLNWEPPETNRFVPLAAIMGMAHRRLS